MSGMLAQIAPWLKANQRWKWLLGFCLSLTGIIGLTGFSFSVPPITGPILESAKWAFGTTFFTIMAFAGFPGMLHQRLTSKHLKILDLVWVLATAFSVAIGVVYVFERSADDVRTSLERNIEASRSHAARQMAFAYQLHCSQASNFPFKQCENLRILAERLDSSGYLSPKIVNSVCPLPIDLSDPPAGFSPMLINGCISANYVAVAPDDPIIKDKHNAMKWKAYLDFWPLLLISLVGLRVMKSIAEVFWQIG